MMNPYFYSGDMTRGRGRIEVILGPMFSGKTTELIRRIRRFKMAKFNCVIIKYAKDNRYAENDVSTHDLLSVRALPCCNLMECKKEAVMNEVIGIDEGQFFPDLVPFCEDLANKGKIVLVAALDGTYCRSSFGSILNLIPLAESVIKLNAICMVCCQSASFTKRITSEKAVELIGGSDKYMAVCRECYNSENVKNSTNRSPLKDNIMNISRQE